MIVPAGRRAQHNINMGREPYYAHCVFCRIATGEVSAPVVYSSDYDIAFLDINPIRRGHIQIIPVEHFDYFDDLPVPVAAEILSVGQQLARALKAVCSVSRVAFLFTGGDIPHAHAHVVPIVEFDDITSRRYIVEDQVSYRDAPRAAESDLASCAALIRASL